jgi:hypothetical protein
MLTCLVRVRLRSSRIFGPLGLHASRNCDASELDRAPRLANLLGLNSGRLIDISRNQFRDSIEEYSVFMTEPPRRSRYMREIQRTPVDCWGDCWMTNSAVIAPIDLQCADPMHRWIAMGSLDWNAVARCRPPHTTSACHALAPGHRPPIAADRRPSSTCR